MSLDFRGQVIESINETNDSVDGKLAMIAALPLQITEGYFGTCKAIVEGPESVTDKINLLQATFLGISAIPEYSMTVGETLQLAATYGTIHEREETLNVALFGDTTRTAALVSEVERALPGCPVITEANGVGFSITMSAKRREEAIALTTAILSTNGFHPIGSRDERLAAR